MAFTRFKEFYLFVECQKLELKHKESGSADFKDLFVLYQRDFPAFADFCYNVSLHFSGRKEMVEPVPITDTCSGSVSGSGDICLKVGEHCTIKLDVGTYSDMLDHFINSMVISCQLDFDEKKTLFRIINALKGEPIRARIAKTKGLLMNNSEEENIVSRLLEPNEWKLFLFVPTAFSVSVLLSLQECLGCDFSSLE